MFYLLEDNRIIEDKKGKYCVRTYPTINDKNVLCSNGKNKYRVGTIKKQSDNVFDLIEKMDLIKLKFGDSYNILEASHIGGGVKGMRGIIAIYKPNSNGDYIKVWEKK